jgi:hypothetical protein
MKSKGNCNPMQIVRAFLALLAGFAAMAAVVGAATAMLVRLAPDWVGQQRQPRTGYVIVNLIYSLAAAILGGYVTAYIASNNILTYTLVLAVIVLLLSGLSALQQRDKQPIWYQLLLMAVAPAGIFLGGLLRLKILGL